MNPVPVRHGMTAGEMVPFIKQNNLIKEANQLPLLLFLAQIGIQII